jgi:hypothetical protein
MTRVARLAILIGGALFPMLAIAQSPAGGQSVVGAAQALRPGEYLWAPEIAPHGPLLLIVSIATQRATLYRNGIPIAITTVSTGRPDHRTPTGVFTILQRQVEHYSNIYDSAPMPYMQRLTWGGVALHGGTLPGYPASHGCIRLPHDFARLLYGVTRLGMTVIVTDEAALPRIAPDDRLALDSADNGHNVVDWHPERAGSGPVSVVISAADQRVVVLRNGVAIGSAPIRIDGPVTGTTVFIRRGAADQDGGWVRVHLPAPLAAPSEESFAGRIHVAAEFRDLVAPLLEAGANVVITTDSLRSSGAEALPFQIEDDAGAAPPD